MEVQAQIIAFDQIKTYEEDKKFELELKALGAKF